MYSENVQSFQLMLMKPLMMAKTGQNMQDNLYIHNRLVTSGGIYTFYIYKLVYYFNEGNILIFDTLHL
jgi:hypothetical protein